MRPLFVALIAAVMLVQVMPAAGGSGDREGPPRDGALLPDVPTPGDDADGTMSLPSSFGGFTENQGQLQNDPVRFYSQGGGVWFTDDGVWYDIGSPGADGGVTLKQEFVGANVVTAQGRGATGHPSHFFLGSDPALWRTDVPTFDEVWYPGLWDGVDLRYYDSGRGLKYDLIVSPGRAVEDIALRYAGAERITVAGGELLVHTAAGAFTDGGLYIYQGAEGTREKIDGRFVTLGECSYGFEITGEYDAALPLVIDPAIQYSTYIGGEADDWGHDLVVDDDGYAYVTGMTSSVDFPSTPGAYNTSLYENYDTFVALLEPGAKDIVYCTYFGGEDDDKPWGIDIDGNDNVFVAGNTESRQLPTTPGAHDTTYNGGNSDAFAMMLSFDGSALMYSTFIGGSLGDYGLDVKLGSLGNAYITGFTYSSNMPVTGGAFDTQYSGSGEGFALKLSSTGSSLGYCTYLGEEGGDIGYSLAVDGSGLVSVYGLTTSSTYPTTAGAYRTSYDSNGANVFISRLNSDGTELLYSTFMGVGSACYNGLALGDDGDIYIAGNADQADHPGAGFALPGHGPAHWNETTGGGGEDIFVAHISPDGNGADDLVFFTMTGGTDDEDVYAMAVGPCGELHVTGSTASDDLPVGGGASDGSHNGNLDAFRAIFDPNGVYLMRSEYVGGGQRDLGAGLAVTKDGSTVIVGHTYSDDFPTTSGVWDESYYAQADGFALALPPAPGVTNMTFLLDGEPASTCYAAKGPYTYQVKVANPLGKDDVQGVQLRLDNTMSSPAVYWEREWNDFSEAYDPDKVIDIEDSSSSYDPATRTWTILYNLILDWEYYYYEYEPRQTMAIVDNDILPTVSGYGFGPAAFVNDLNLTGTLKLTGEDGRDIPDGGIVRGGEVVEVTGLRAVYDGTADVYPPWWEYGIMVSDEEGMDWSDYGYPYEPFSINIIAPNVTYSEEKEYTVSLVGIPGENDVSDVGFTLWVDGHGVEFMDHITSIMDWHTTSNVTVGVTITDIGGGRVNGSSIQVSVSPDGGSTWGSWRNVTYDDAETVVARTIQELPDGRDVRVMWRASDTLGNGPDVDISYIGMVDTEYVKFSGLFTEDSGDDHLRLLVNVTDVTSGVNESSVVYSYSADAGATWSEWWVPGAGDIFSSKSTPRSPEELVVVSFKVEKDLGERWRLRLRATDSAGNGPTLSPAYALPPGSAGTQWKPVVALTSPADGTAVQVLTAEFSWTLIAGPANVTYDVYLNRYSPPENKVEKEYSGTNYTVTGLEHKMTYYWMVVPVLSNGTEGTCLDGHWSFYVDVNAGLTGGTFNISLQPVGDATVARGDHVDITVNVTNTGDYYDTIRLEIYPENMDAHVSILGPDMLDASPGETVQFRFRVGVDPDVEPGSYKVTVSAVSVLAEEAGRSVNSETDLWLTVVASKDDTHSGTAKADEPEGLGIGAVVMAAAIVIALLGIFVTLFLLMKMGMVGQGRRERGGERRDEGEEDLREF